MAKFNFGSSIIAPILKGFSNLFDKDDEEEEEKKRKEEEKRKANSKKINPPSENIAPVKKTYTIADSSPLAPITKNATPESTTQKKKTEKVAPVATFSPISPMFEMDYRPETVPGMVGAINKNLEGEWYDRILKSPEVLTEALTLSDISAKDTGNILKSSANDLALNIISGAGNFVEGITDAVGYGVSDALGAFGADNFASKLHDKAKENTVQNLLSDEFEKNDKNSIFGDYADSAAQGLGQIGVNVLGGSVLKGLGLGTKALSAASSIGIGMSGAGSGMSEAYQNDATDKEAKIYGMITGAAESLSELMFGGLGKVAKAAGIGKGLLSIDDMFAKKVSGIFENQIAKNLTEYAIKSGAESIEEAVAGFASAIGQKMTYRSEDDFWAILRDQNIIEQMITSFATSAIAQAGDLHTANKNKTDFISGLTSEQQKEIDKAIAEEKKKNTLTETERKVVDKETENRIKEEEKDGKKLKRKEKDEIRERVIADLDKGYISTDTIESILGGEGYSRYSKISSLRNDYKSKIEEKISRLQGEYDTLNKMKRGDMTGEQQDRQADIKEQLTKYKDDLNALNEDTRADELKTKIGTDVRNLVKDTRLEESYKEINDRRKEALQVDFDKYKGSKNEEAVKKTLENAVKAKANNSNRVRDTVEMQAKLSSETGIVFDYKTKEQIKNDFLERQSKEIERIESIPTEERTVEQNELLSDMKKAYEDVRSGKRVINGYADGNNVVLNINEVISVRRVSGHEISHILKPDTKTYDGLKDVLFGYAESKGVNIEEEIRTRNAMYQGVKGADAEAELVSDLLGDYIFTDYDFIKALSTENRNVFQKVYDEIKYLYKLATAGSKEARDLEKVKRNFEKALTESVNAKNTTGEGGVRYSFSGTKSKNYNFSLLEQAIRLEDVGKATSEEIRQQTGWFRGYDNKWRYEISDRDIEIDTTGKFSNNPDIRRSAELYEKLLDMTATDAEIEELRALDKNLEGVKIEPKTLGELIKHDKLFEAYPQLKDMPVHFADIDSRGAYVPMTKDIVLQKKLKLNKDKLRKTLIHEIQHAIQDIEGFAGGSNPDYWQDSGFSEEEARKFYENTAGEIEARDAATRWWRTDESRKETRPDIDRSDVVFSEDNISSSSKEYIEKTNEILYNKNSTLSVENRAKTNNNSSLKWVYDAEIFSVEESKLFHEEISRINQNSRALDYTKNTVGEYMIPVGNKIVFTDGDYEYPYVREVVEVLTEIQDEYETIRRCIFNVEKGESDKQNEMQVLNEMYGPGRIISYKSGTGEVYDWENGRRKGRTRKAVIRNYLNKQFRKGNDRKSREAQINKTAPIKEASSEDGAIFNSDKKDLSLSNSERHPFVPYTADDVSGKDFVVQKPLAPIKKVAEQKSEAPGIAPIKNTGKKFTTLDIVEDDTEVKAEVKSEEAKVKSEEASSVSVSLSDTSLDNIAKTVRKTLSLTPAEKKTVKEIVQRYAESGVRDTEQLFKELRDNFAERSFKERVEEIADVKHALKSFKIFVPQNIKNGITDYSDFRRRNFGKLTISNEGTSVDKVYEGLSYSFPNFFPPDIANDTDRLMQMEEVGNLEIYKNGTDMLSDESIREVAEVVDDVVNTAKEKQAAKEAERAKRKAEREAEKERKKLLIKKNMSNEERTELLKHKKIENVAVVNNAFPTPNIENFKWEDIDKVAGKEKRNIINKLAKEFGAFKEYTNKDIELTFNFSNNNFRESYSKQSKNYQTFAKMFSVFDKVIESAVGIEAHNRNKEGYKPDETLKNVYVLLSAFEDGENIVPVKLEIKEFNDKDNTLYVAVALETIKKTEVWKQGNAENGEAQNSRSVNISIPDLISKINPKDTGFTKYVPKGMLTEEQVKELRKSERTKYHDKIIDGFKAAFREKGFDMDKVLLNAENLPTIIINDTKPNRVMKKTLGFAEGDVLADLTVNKVAQNESEGIKWLNSFLDRKSGLLAKISEQYGIEPGSKESAAAQMYAEGFYVNKMNEVIAYGDRELIKDFKDPKVRQNIVDLANDKRIRQIYDETLEAINEARKRNLYPEIPRLDNYFLHFRAMGDTFSKIGIPFNKDVINADNLPTNLNGVTLDLKPGQPYFASAKHREGIRTDFDLLGGLEKYLTSAKNQIYHIDDIQNLRALRNYIAEMFGEAQGMRNLDSLSENEVQSAIKEHYNKHLSNFAKFLNEEANILAGKKSLIDRGVEGATDRWIFPFLDALNKQYSNNVLGFNVSSPLTNFVTLPQAFAKLNKTDFVKGFAQFVSNKIKSVKGIETDGFAEVSPVLIRRKGAEQFYRKPYEKITDKGYWLMGVTDDVSSEIIARAKYNELIRKGMDSQKAHFETDKWVSDLMGDRSYGQMPLAYNSKILGLVTKFQLEVRNQLDSQFYDTIQEAKLSTKDIENRLKRNAKLAAKAGATIFQLAVGQHVFGQLFEKVVGYNPAFDMIEVIATALGFDDDEDDEDTVLDNIEEGFFALMEDLPYTSILTGGRIPLSSMLPYGGISDAIEGISDDISKQNWKNLGLEALDTALNLGFPTGYGQLKKTAKGLHMFSDKHPIKGSYTDSGNLRFPIDDTAGNRVQAALFGQYANKNAREYFDEGFAPLRDKQIEEFKETGMSYGDYQKYREGLSGLKTLNEKGDYIGGLDVPVSTKNILINNIADREEPIDMSNYGKYKDFQEFDLASRYDEKYRVLKEQGVSVKDYKENHEKTVMIFTDDYSWAADNPEQYAISKAVTDDVTVFRKYKNDISAFEADKDKYGNSINGSKKKKQKDYIFSLPIEYGQKIILYRSMFDSKADKRAYNNDIIDYLISREDLSEEDKIAILEKLDFTVDEEGYVTW